VKAERTEDSGSDGVDLAASPDTCVCVCVCAGVPLGVGVLLAVYVEELFAGVDICDCTCEGGVSSVGDARVLDEGGGDDKEEETTTAAAAWPCGDDEGADAELVSWKGAGAALPPFVVVVVREEPDADAAALEGDAVAAPSRADAGRVDEDDGPDAFDFPLSVEW